MARNEVAIVGLGTALPRFQVTQHEAGSWLTSYLDYPRLTERFVDRLFRLSSVEKRYSVLPDFTNPLESTLYRNGLPGLQERMRVFRSRAPQLAKRACDRALRQAGVSPGEATHLVVVTSTGFFTPGPDVDLVDLMGLSRSVERTVVSMSGCAGAFPGIRIARRIAADDPTAVVLMVCVELSSIHLDDESDHDKIVAFSLFGDGAAAAVLTASPGLADAVAVLGESETQLVVEGRDLLKWDLKATGFSISLSEDLAPFFRERVAGFVTPLVAKATGGCGDPRAVASWLVHPGGPAILRGVQSALDLKPDALDSSWEVLKDGGNLSSAAVLFVLQREQARRKVGDRAVLLGFGPGLALEGFTLVLGGRDPGHL